MGRMTWVLWQCFAAPGLALQCLPAVLVASEETASVPCVTLSPWGMAAPGSGRASTGLEALSTCSELQFLCFPSGLRPSGA